MAIGAILLLFACHGAANPQAESDPRPADAAIGVSAPRSSAPSIDDSSASDATAGDTQPFDARLILCDSTASANGWLICQSGGRLTVNAARRFRLEITVAMHSIVAWRVVEANPIRLRLHRAAQPSEWTVYADGRQFLDGRWGGSWIRQDAMSVAFAAAHRSPASISVPAEQGAVVRNSPGDAHNDGYNELRASYELRAAAGRIEAQVTPGAAPLARPVFEIIGLPPGRIIASADGTLVEQTFRCADGRVLVEFPPGLIDRPVSLSVSSVTP